MSRFVFVLQGSAYAALACGSILLAAGNASAAEYYVAPTGNDSNAGTMAQPFATMQKGHDVAVAGDTVWIRGGTYKVVNGYNDSSGFTISKSGQSDAKRIKFWAYPGELPIFDFSQLRMSSTKKVNAIYVTGSWLHFKGLEIANVPQPGTYTNSGLLTDKTASNNVFELLNIHHVGGPGLFISGGNGGNLILNCDAHDNYDAGSSQGRGENADGFGVHYQSTGPSTIVRGCRAWWNSDDGYDLISQEVPVTIESSWAMGNGYIDSGTGKGGNGNGFKAGSSKTGIRHTIRNCVAWKNTAAGFYANHSSGGNNWFNNTSYNNAVQYNMLASPPDDSATTIILSGALAHKMRNNVGFPDKNSNMGGVDTAFNTWDLKIVPSNNDFVGVTDTGFMGPRQADGSPPALDFMRLRAGSQLIDKGTDVGDAFVGPAPDLGAYEYGLPTSSGTDGGSASGGASGAGGDMGASGTVAGNGAAGTVGTGDTGGALAGTGGSVSATGGVGGSGGQNGNMATDPEAASGCACTIGATSRAASNVSLLSVLAALGVGLRRRRRRDTCGLSLLATVMALAVGCGADSAPLANAVTGGSSGSSGLTSGAGGTNVTGGSPGAGGGAVGAGGSPGSGGDADASLTTSDASTPNRDAGVEGGVPGQRTTFQNQQAFVDLRYGMFIHFNMGTFHDMEWVTPNLDPLTFAPKDVNTDQWAAAAKAGGMKFAVLTTKHHDGFALWPTKVSSYNVMSSSYKVDVVKKFVDSFRAAGVTPCLYFSIWDRTQGIAQGSVSKADLDFIVAQLTELLGGTYGEFPLIMFDGWTWQMGRNEVPYQLIRETVRRLQPNILMVDHNGLTQAFEEDVLNFEHFGVPATNTLASTQGNPIMPKWFWHPGYDALNPLSASTLLGRLGTTESHWCNFLLDCPPNPDGVMDKNVVDRLAEVGAQWKPNLARGPLPAQPIQLEHPVTPVAVTATSGTAASAIDGMNDYVSGKTVQTLWQSAAGLPQSVTMDFGSVYDNLEFLGYMPRQDHVTDGAVTSAYVTTGNITGYTIYASTDGNSFTKVTSGTWPADGLIKRLQFPPVTARFLRLEATAVSGATYAVISEIDAGGVTLKPTVMN